jgi:hypothetical protein
VDEVIGFLLLLEVVVIDQEVNNVIVQGGHRRPLS